MFNLIEKYISNMSISDFNNMALLKDIHFSTSELEFAYGFIRSKWKDVLSNYESFNLSKYKGYFSEDNFNKISQLLNDAYLKYGHYLK